MKLLKIFLSTTLFLYSSILLQAQIAQTIRGKVTDETTKRPLEGATITIENTNYKLFTDNNGVFNFKNIPTGRYEISVSNVGYTKRKLTELLLQSGKELVIEVELSASVTTLDEATISAASPNLSGALTSINTITTEQVMRYPATFMDPARLAQTFAGVVNTNDQANGISVRGNNPNTLQWRLEGVEIVNPNHTSNAGTFSDLPTAAGGGVNILSAQLLGNMNFLTGAFPAEYGNALGGVMDMRLRKGNNQKREYTAQVGFVGVDLSAEGPFSKKSKASYLINYRYSFTGLLGLGGIDFGGEAISFQDLSFNISLPSKKLGNFTIFGMGGKSSNIFSSPADKAEWEEEKDQYDIDFKSKMGALGITHEKSFKKTLWRNVVAISSTESTREQWNKTFSDAAFTVPKSNLLAKQLISYSSTFQQKIGEKHSLKYGSFFTYQKDGILSFSNQKVFSQGIVVQPFTTFTLHPTEKITANIGVHFLNYVFNQFANSFEPRASLNYQINDRNSVAVSYGLHSQIQLNQAFLLNDVTLSKSHHLVANHKVNLSESMFLKTEIFYQRLFNIPNIKTIDNQIFPNTSSINIIDEFPNRQFLNSGFGTNYGVEITLQKYLTNGFFLLANTTLFKSMVETNQIRYNSRFNNEYIINATIGKEWKKGTNKIWGLNGRAVWLGGYRNTPIDIEASRLAKTTIYEPNSTYILRSKDYFRPDIRVYFRKSKEKYSRMLSIDIQNIINYENFAYTYYDSFLDEVVIKKQLGMIPMLNYRWEF